MAWTGAVAAEAVAADWRVTNWRFEKPTAYGEKNPSFGAVHGLQVALRRHKRLPPSTMMSLTTDAFGRPWPSAPLLELASARRASPIASPFH